MKKYKHLITITIFTILLAVLNSLISGVMIKLICSIICAVVITVQIIILSDSEKIAFDKLMEHIPKIIHIITVIVAIDVLIFNITKIEETNRVYEKCGSGTFKYNSVAIKQLDIDISAVGDIVFKIGREMTVEEFYDKYSDTGKNIPYATLITIFIDGFDISDIPNAVYFGYKTYKHFNKTWANFIETVIVYLLIIWEVCYSVGLIKHKNKQKIIYRQK